MLWTKFESGTVASEDGTEIYYEVRGDGPPIVLVYGIACIMNHWNLQIQHFAKTHSVITYDLRGHQRSLTNLNADHLNMDWMAKDLVCLLRALKLKNVAAAGHSYGVPILIQSYLKAPELFDRLIFVNGFARSPVKKMFGLDAVEKLFSFVHKTYNQAPSVFEQLWKSAVQNPVSTYLAAFAGGFNLKVASFKDVEIYSKGVAQMRLEHFMPLFGEMFELNMVSDLPALDLPVLVIEGENDLVTPKELQQDFMEHLPEKEYVRVPYGSHCTQLDFPDYVNLKIEKFLGRVISENKLA